MKIFPQKGGHGHVTAWRCTLGSAEVRRAGFINENGESFELEKIVNESEHTITIRIKSQDAPQSASDSQPG